MIFLRKEKKEYSPLDDVTLFFKNKVFIVVYISGQFS